ncbi:MAG: hypothetical protein MJD61_03680 [Proteobacteria bacterium]|nr:hypothetical protein [Pseudomonadota bacterium]
MAVLLLLWASGALVGTASEPCAKTVRALGWPARQRDAGKEALHVQLLSQVAVTLNPQ